MPPLIVLKIIAARQKRAVNQIVIALEQRQEPAEIFRRVQADNANLPVQKVVILQREKFFRPRGIFGSPRNFRLLFLKLFLAEIRAEHDNLSVENNAVDLFEHGGQTVAALPTFAVADFGVLRIVHQIVDDANSAAKIRVVDFFNVHSVDNEGVEHERLTERKIFRPNAAFKEICIWKTRHNLPLLMSRIFAFPAAQNSGGEKFVNVNPAPAVERVTHKLYIPANVAAEKFVEQAKGVAGAVLRRLIIFVQPNIAQKAEIFQKAVIDQIFIVAVTPEQIRPIAVNFANNFLGKFCVDFVEPLLELGFEVLKIRERFAARIHRDVNFVGETHVLDWHEIKRDGVIFERAPEILHAAEFFVDGVEHGEHGADGRVFLPAQREPRLVGYFVRQRFFAELRLELHEVFAKILCVGARLVGKILQKSQLVLWNFFPPRRIPVQ